MEMNNEVRGEFLDESVERILEDKPQFLTTFTLVVATDLSEKSLKAVSRILWDAGVPLVLVKSCGFIAYIRLQVRLRNVCGHFMSLI